MKKRYFLIFIIFIIIMLFSIIIMNNIISNIELKNIQKKQEGELEKELLTYSVYNTQDDIIQLLVNVNLEEGIEYVEIDNNSNKIFANNNKSISFDLEVKKNENTNLKIKGVYSGIIEKNINIDEQFISDTVISIDTVQDIPGYKVFELNKNEDFKFDDYTRNLL